MHRDGRVSHALEFAVKSAHAIDERARRQQRLALDRASVGESGSAAGFSLSR
jgi:hypothetical protein